jgi:hypothetical protein
MSLRSDTAAAVIWFVRGVVLMTAGEPARDPRLLGNRRALYRWTAEISPPGRSSRCGGVLIGRP